MSRGLDFLWKDYHKTITEIRLSQVCGRQSPQVSKSLGLPGKLFPREPAMQTAHNAPKFTNEFSTRDVWSNGQWNDDFQ